VAKAAAALARKPDKSALGGKAMAMWRLASAAKLSAAAISSLLARLAAAAANSRHRSWRNAHQRRPSYGISKAAAAK